METTQMVTCQHLVWLSGCLPLYQAQVGLRLYRAYIWRHHRCSFALSSVKEVQIRVTLASTAMAFVGGLRPRCEFTMTELPTCTLNKLLKPEPKA